MSPTSDLYARKSTVDAGRSAARQERDWRADCVTLGATPGTVFVDPDLSASRYARKDRPDWNQLVQHVRGLPPGRIISMWETSRGSRQLGEWVEFLELCRERGVLIRIFGGEDPCTFNPRSRRDWRQLAEEGLDAHDESARLSDRVRAGTRDSARQGKPPGPLLFGYTRAYDERGKFVAQTIHPERGALVRRFVTDTLRGVSLNSQAQRLNDAGVASPRGGAWTGQGIARILRNPGYVGKRQHNGEVVADAVWPPLLTVKQHRQLLRLLSAPGRRPHADSTLVHMLSGAARCVACERVLRTQGGQRYCCTWRGCMAVSARIEPMNRFVEELVRQRLRAPEAELVFAPPSDDAELQAAEAELAGLQARLAEFVAQASDPRVKLSAASLAAVEGRLAPQIEAAERRVRKLSTPAVLARYADVDVASRWDELPVGVRREFVLVIADVVLGRCGKGGRWSPWRLAGSRWHGEDVTWGEKWERAGRVAGV